MKTTGKYNLDAGIILDKCYDLLCIFFSNKELSRRINPSDIDSPLNVLRDKYFESKVSRLLIEIATSLRVLDDQMKKMPKDSESFEYYIGKVKYINETYEFCLFDDASLTLRDVCNKIIHSDIFQIHLTNGIEAHELDIEFKEGYSERNIIWNYPRENVRLAGTGQGSKKKWFALLNIEYFIAGVSELLLE